MATTKPRIEIWDRQRLAWIAAGILAAGFLGWFLLGLRKPPQMGAEPEVFATVDALYTAVRNRDEPRLAKCEQRLVAYRKSGKLPDASARYLDDIIADARGGGWTTAAQRLYDFMLAQRREGGKNSHRKNG